MPKEKTSKRVAKIASKQLKSRSTSKPAKATAGSALTQYEPKKIHAKHAKVRHPILSKKK